MNMAPQFAYHILSSDRTLDSFTGVLTHGDDEGCAQCKKSSTRSLEQKLHWVIHACSLIAVVGLLALVMRYDNGAGRAARCWDMHNYYCEQALPFLRAVGMTDREVTFLPSPSPRK